MFFSRVVIAYFALFAWHFVKLTSRVLFELGSDQRISNTCSGGRPMAAFSLASTIGRSIRIGCLTINSIKESSDRVGLLRLYSV